MIKSIEKLPAAECPKFLHRVVDGVCGRSPPKMADYGTRWSLTEWMELLDALSAIFRLTVGKNIPDKEVKESLAELDSSYSDAVLGCLKARHEEIRQSLVERTNAVSSAQLQDFDWQIKLALSSDKISSLQTPLLNLSLDIREGGAVRPVSIEMNREELQGLVSSLEGANKVVLQLK
ncbi:COMM domain-containing protein 8 [Brienomyrus brachyistius]|uniref:COMM domain-containing protein 8 n=1 Tax=Brienomyrus brachyistius TaxID=42636 RepID=UPI0020B31D87|nr:COMM domain-containing protein 8 [Brienomyrus brachyistius]